MTEASITTFTGPRFSVRKAASLDAATIRSEGLADSREDTVRVPKASPALS